MNWRIVRLAFSTTMLAFAVALAAWGIYRIVSFKGSHYNAAFYISDGLPSFFWGCALLLMGYLFRFRFRIHALSLLAVIDFVVLGWKQVQVRKHQLDADFFSELIAVCVILFVLVILDHSIQRTYDFVRQKVKRG